MKTNRKSEKNPSEILIVDISSNRKERQCRRQSRRNTLCQANAIKGKIERGFNYMDKCSSVEIIVLFFCLMIFRKNKIFRMKSFIEKNLHLYIYKHIQEEENDSERERDT